MRKASGGQLVLAAVLCGLTLIPANADDWPTVTLPDWPFRRTASADAPNTLAQIARSIDYVEDKILDDGVVVTKKPDVWGQARMTLYRKDFETMMKARGPDDFQAILAARVSRLDAAAFQSQSNLSLSLANAPTGGRGGRAARAPASGGGANAVTSPTIVAMPAPSGGGHGQGDGSGGSGGAGGSPGAATGQFWNVAPLPTDAPFALLPGKQPFSDMSTTYGGKLGLDPPVFLDEKKRYFDHLNEIRRVNIGDDNADSAGYGLYLVRMPVSIQPGECTLKGHGAVLTVTARHEFDPNFLRNTFHNLVINDLVDQLGPIVYELIRNGVVERQDEQSANLAKSRQRYFNSQMEVARKSQEMDARIKDIYKRIDLLGMRMKKEVGDQTRQYVVGRVLLRINEFKAMIQSAEHIAEHQAPDAARLILDALIYYTIAPDRKDEKKSTDAAITIAGDVSRALSGSLKDVHDSQARLESDFGVPTRPDPDHSDTVAGAAAPGPADVQARLATIEKLLIQLKSEFDEIRRVLIEGPKEKPIVTETAGLLIFPQNLPVVLKDFMRRVDEFAKIVARDGKPASIPYDLGSYLDKSVVDRANEYLDKVRQVREYSAELKQFDLQLEDVRRDPSNPGWAKKGIGELNTKLDRLTGELTQYLENSKSGSKACPAPEAPRDICEIIDAWRAIATEHLQKAGEDAKSPPGGRASSATDRVGTQRSSSEQDATSLANLLRGLPELIDALPSQRADVENMKTMLDKQVTGIAQLQSALLIERVASWAFPSTRFGVRTYPVSPSDIDDVFLKDGLLTLVRKTRDALPTEVPRADDVRSYLRHELEAAYDLLEHYQCDVIAIAELVRARDFGRLRNKAFPMLVSRLPGDLKGQPDDVISILCWSVAVECGLLDRQLKLDMKATAEKKGNHDAAPLVDPDSLLFYETAPSQEARTAFARYVRARWPMIVFALDPFVDQQNIADAMSLRRDLQLALAFSFATGKINFSQLNQYNRKVEQDAETIALNRTVTSFSHGGDTFGWRFYPRYQNPPQEATNLHVIGNMLLRGGPGRNYQINNSKLEAGQRELTAVIVMPSFLERVRFDVTGNWFPLHDPDKMQIPTTRMIEQGRKVVELRHALEMPEICDQYRPDDLDRLKVRVDQVEAMLPMQTHRVQVPYENALGGFQLFTPGSTALVPEVTGFEGAESVEEGKPTDLMIFGRHFSLHETKVVVGGKVLVPDEAIPPTTKSLGGTQVDIVSREVVHVKLPADVRPTLIRNVGDKELARSEALKPTPYVELFLATPTGISNRLLIPFKASDAPSSAGPEPSSAAEASYVFLDVSFNVQGTITANQPSTTRTPSAGSSATVVNPSAASNKTKAPARKPGDTSPDGASGAASTETAPAMADQTVKFVVKPMAYQSWESIRIVPTQIPASESDTIDVEFHFPVESDIYISVKVFDVAYKDGAYAISADALTKLARDLLKKLDAYGKLTGKDAVTELTTKSVLITPRGSSGPPKVTRNPLKVTIMLFAQPLKAPAGDGGKSDAEATPAAATGVKTSTPSVASPQPVKTSFSPSAPATELDPLLVRASGSASSQPSVPEYRRPPQAQPKLPAPSAGRSQRRVDESSRPVSSTDAASSRSGRPLLNRPAREMTRRQTDAPNATEKPGTAQPPRRSILSRITGRS